MSDQSKHPNEGTPNHSAPGKRLAKKEPAPVGGQDQKQKEKRVMIIMIVAAVIMAIAASVVLLVNRWFVKPSLPPGPDPVGTSKPKESKNPLTEDPDPEETLNFDAIQPKVGGARKSEDIYTILIFGTDTTSGLTDSMMVATYDVTNQRATVMSLPRDTLINSSARPGINAKKLNAVYKVYGNGDSGVAALKNEVGELVGYVPDYYVKIDWDLVGDMVDAIGGVWFDNPYHMEYYDPYQDLEIYQEQGYRKLDGNSAMQVVRWRHNNPGVPYNPGVSKATVASDLERLDVQHAFLKAVLEQTLQIQNIVRVGQLIDLFNSRVESDLRLEEMFWFAREAVLGGLQVEDVDFCTMPTMLGLYGKDSFVYPIQSELLTLINESLNPYVEQVTIRQLDLMSVGPNGGLRSSTGRLAEPSLANPPVAETQDPEESDPLESGDPEEGEENPLESGDPENGEENPQESGDPGGSQGGSVIRNPSPAASDPGTDDPAQSVPGTPDPAAAGPGPAQEDDPPVQTGPDNTLASEPTPEPAPAGEPEGGDWGESQD